MPVHILFSSKFYSFAIYTFTKFMLSLEVQTHTLCARALLPLSQASWPT